MESQDDNGKMNMERVTDQDKIKMQLSPRSDRNYPKKNVKGHECWKTVYRYYHVNVSEFVRILQKYF